MKNFVLALTLILSLAIAPVPALAQTDTGPTPGSFWYGVTTTFENVNLFFTFNNEKKAEKALDYAEKRLAQAKSSAESKNSDGTEIALADYEAKLNLATESSKKVDDERAGKLLATIASSTAKHQETLSAVLEKAPEEAREAIAKAIEASKREQDEAMQKIADLRGEVEQLKQEIAELKAKDEDREEKIEELSKQKSETSATSRTQTTPTQKTEPAQSQTVPKIETPKITTITLPNGAVVEMDANGNIVRTIKEAQQTQDTNPQSSSQERYYDELLRQQQEDQIRRAVVVEQQRVHAEQCLSLRKTWTQKILDAQNSGTTIGFAAGETARVKREMLSAFSAAGCDIDSSLDVFLQQYDYTTCNYGYGSATCY